MGTTVDKSPSTSGTTAHISHEAPGKAPETKPLDAASPTGFSTGDTFAAKTAPALTTFQGDGSVTPQVTPIKTNGANGDVQLASYGDDQTVTVQRRGAAPPLPAEITAETAAQYREGPPTRPDIRHDNGFLQNPDDPTDPNPIPTVSPGVGDYVSLARWEAQLAGARAIQGVPNAPHNDIPDALDGYDHFLHGNGADHTFSYDRFVETDGAGKVVLDSAIRDVQTAAEARYAEMVRNDPSLAGKTVTFDITGSPIAVGGTDQANYPYPYSENWQKAIGGHQIWNSAHITVSPPDTPGGKPRFEMEMTLHAEDRYNFNPGQHDLATGTPDEVNGRFELTGLGHQYMNYAELRRDVSWSQGDLTGAVVRRAE